MKTYSGYITYFNSRKKYGFINCPELQIDDLFFHKGNCSKSYKHIYSGDKITFEKQEDVNDNKLIIQNISFIHNLNIEALKKDFENQRILKGYLKKIEDRFFVKDIDSYIFIPLVISKNETNTVEYYESKLNNLLEYKILSLSKRNKIRATTINKQFKKGLELVLERSDLEGHVVEFVKGGYIIRVIDDIFGFLPNSFVEKQKNSLEIGEIIRVSCINKNIDFSSIIFDLSENINNEKRRLYEEEEFKKSLMIGDKFLGIVKESKGFGIFLSIGRTDGLLHSKHLIQPKAADFSAEQRKRIGNIIKEVFIKGLEIPVFIDEINNGRCSLAWDISIEPNKTLYKMINEKFDLIEYS